MRVRFDKKIEKSIMTVLDSLASKFGLADTRHGVNKWSNRQKALASIQKEQKRLQDRLAELERAKR